MSERDLTTDEGVDEGSAASTAEAQGPERDATGQPPRGRPRGEADPAPPDGTTSTDARGQALEVGEG